MKTLNVTVPEKKASATIRNMIVGFMHRRIPGKPPIELVTLKLTAPINGETALVFRPGEPGYAELASVLDVEKAISAALTKRFPDAEIKDLPVKEPKKTKAESPAKPQKNVKVSVEKTGKE